MLCGFLPFHICDTEHVEFQAEDDNGVSSPPTVEDLQCVNPEQKGWVDVMNMIVGRVQ